MNQINTQQNFNLTKYDIFILENYKNCPLHDGYQLSVLSLDINSKQLLQCPLCISHQHYQHLIPLLQLISSDNNTIFKNWPFKDDQQIYDKLVEISTKKPYFQYLQAKISDYFKQLRSIIENKLAQKEKEMIKQSEILLDINERVILQYNEFSAKEELKDIIYNKQLLNESISRVLHDQERNKQQLLESINNLISQESMINFEISNQIEDKIIQLIEKIDLFKNDELQYNKIKKYSEDNLNLYQNKLKNIKPFELATNELRVKEEISKNNNMSNPLINNLQYFIGKLSIFLDKLGFKCFINQELLDVALDKLNDEQFEYFRTISKIFSNAQLDEKDKSKLKKLKSQEVNDYHRLKICEELDKNKIFIEQNNQINIQVINNSSINFSENKNSQTQEGTQQIEEVSNQIEERKQQLEDRNQLSTSSISVENTLNEEIIEKINKIFSNESLKIYDENKYKLYKQLFEKNYFLLNFLKPGCFSDYFEGYSVDSQGVQYDYVFKILQHSNKDLFDEETQIMKSFEKYSNIISFIDSFNININRYNYYIIVLEKFQYSLKDELIIMKKKLTPFTLQMFFKIIFDCLDCLNYLRINNTVHFDIKPNNIFKNQQGQYCISEFALSQKILNNNYLFNVKGFTKSYAPQEQIKNSYIGFHCDIYSMGKTLQEVLEIFENENNNPSEQQDKIVKTFKIIIKENMLLDEYWKRKNCLEIHTLFFEHIKYYKEFQQQYLEQIEKIINSIQQNEHQDCYYFKEQRRHYILKKFQLKENLNKIDSIEFQQEQILDQQQREQKKDSQINPHVINQNLEDVNIDDMFEYNPQTDELECFLGISD